VGVVDPETGKYTHENKAYALAGYIRGKVSTIYIINSIGSYEGGLGSGEEEEEEQVADHALVCFIIMMR